MLRCSRSAPALAVAAGAALAVALCTAGPASFARYPGVPARWSGWLVIEEANLAHRRRRPHLEP
jgi:hypothetical protein